jgi:hypothetical protein
MDTHTCCFTEVGRVCQKPASFEIKETTREDPDNFTYACEEHVGHMLGTTAGYPECRSWAISAIMP